MTLSLQGCRRSVKPLRTASFERNYHVAFKSAATFWKYDVVVASFFYFTTCTKLASITMEMIHFYDFRFWCTKCNYVYRSNQLYISYITRNTLTQASTNGRKPYLFPQKKFISVFYAINIFNTIYYFKPTNFICA